MKLNTNNLYIIEGLHIPVLKGKIRSKMKLDRLVTYGPLDPC